MRHRSLTFTAILGLLLICSGAALAQSYHVINLSSNLNNRAKHLDTLLANPWGIVYAPGAPFWVSDEASGWSTLYDGSGNAESLQVVIPPASGSGPGTPTGIVFNGSSEFQIDSWTSVFLFDSLDGTISGWSTFNPSAALIGATNPGAVYTGLAITSKTSGNILFAADAANNKVDMYDGSFNLVGSFTDSTVPAGFSPFGIQDIGGQVYVAYAATNGGPGGYIDIFGEDGTFLKRFTQAGHLNQPWGMAVAPSNFGPFSGALLITNNSSGGIINGFDLKTGKLISAIKDSSGNAIHLNGIWGIEFGGGSANNGKTNQLFFTAGPNDVNGFFGMIDYF
ncbi:MAG TPA: TIGR03118 family protein [Candidatus Sulfotelmatobacter sp.]